MIVIILIFAVLLFSASMIFLPKGLSRLLWIAASFLLMAASILVISLNDNQHLGMHQVQQVLTEDLASGTAVRAKRLGTGTEKQYLYRLKVTPKRWQAVPAKPNTTVKVHHGAQLATVKITTSRWVYRNAFWRIMLGISGENNLLANQVYQFYLNK